jgi:hypothetical protein
VRGAGQPDQPWQRQESPCGTCLTRGSAAPAPLQAPAAAADASASTGAPASLADVKAGLMQALEGIDRGIFGVQVAARSRRRCRRALRARRLQAQAACRAVPIDAPPGPCSGAAPHPAARRPPPAPPRPAADGAQAADPRARRAAGAAQPRAAAHAAPGPGGGHLEAAVHHHRHHGAARRPAWQRPGRQAAHPPQLRAERAPEAATGLQVRLRLLGEASHSPAAPQPQPPSHTQGSKKTKLGLREFVKLGAFTQSIDVQNSVAVSCCRALPLELPALSCCRRRCCFLVIFLPLPCFALLTPQ